MGVELAPRFQFMAIALHGQTVMVMIVLVGDRILI